MGREVVEKLTGKTVLDSMDGFFTATANTPSWYVGYCLLSFRSNQLCCRFDFNTFSLVFYRHRAWSITGDYCLFLAGSMLTGGTFWFVTGLFILFALTVVIFMAKKIWLERQKRNA